MPLSENELVDAMAESAHEAWVEAYQSWGFTSRKAEWGEEFMVPWAELSERGRELDRVIMRGILRMYNREGFEVVRRAS